MKNYNHIDANSDCWSNI